MKLVERLTSNLFPFFALTATYLSRLGMLLLLFTEKLSLVGIFMSMILAALKVVEKRSICFGSVLQYTSR